jgi:hypothetical protein
MELAFLGDATTVTGSQFLLDTRRARVLIDCGMFEGSPNETVRNRHRASATKRWRSCHRPLGQCRREEHLVAALLADVELRADAGEVYAERVR